MKNRVTFLSGNGQFYLYIPGKQKNRVTFKFKWVQTSLNNYDILNLTLKGGVKILVKEVEIGKEMAKEWNRKYFLMDKKEYWREVGTDSTLFNIWREKGIKKEVVKEAFMFYTITIGE